MRKIILVSIIAIAAILCPFKRQTGIQIIKSVEKDETTKLLNEALALLKFRKDRAALVIFEMILLKQPDNLDALGAKAEVFRRGRHYREAEELLNKILSKNPKHSSSLISLAHIRCKEDRLDEALALVNKVLDTEFINKDNQALAYVILSSINNKYASKCWLLGKIKYARQIKCYLLKAKALAPDLPEAHLGLGTFYLLAPGIMGGNLDKAIEELEYTVKLAPDFATANARLAQAYKKRGDLEKYNFYLKRARELDPENEVLKELDEKFRD